MELILGCKKLKMKAVGIRGDLNASLGMTENKLIVIKIKIILTFRTGDLGYFKKIAQTQCTLLPAQT